MTDCRQAISETELTAIAKALTSLVDIAAQQCRGTGEVSFDYKGDGSRVTEVDRHIERAWRDVLARDFPDHAVAGEELDDTGSGDFCWHLDPIDGTDDFSRGIPLFACLIAVSYKGLPVAGAIGHPRLDTVVSGVFGRGVNVNGERISLAEEQEVPDPAIAIPAFADFHDHDVPLRVFEDLVAALPNYRTFRNAYGHTAVITGALQAAVEVGVAEWDIAATRFLVEEAGGQFTELSPGFHGGDAQRTSAIFGAPGVVNRIQHLLGATAARSHNTQVEASR